MLGEKEEDEGGDVVEDGQGGRGRGREAGEGFEKAGEAEGVGGVGEEGEGCGKRL